MIDWWAVGAGIGIGGFAILVCHLLGGTLFGDSKPMCGGPSSLATISNGTVTGITITSGGSPYTSAVSALRSQQYAAALAAMNAHFNVAILGAHAGAGGAFATATTGASSFVTAAGHMGVAYHTPPSGPSSRELLNASDILDQYVEFMKKRGVENPQGLPSKFFGIFLVYEASVAENGETHAETKEALAMLDAAAPKVLP